MSDPDPQPDPEALRAFLNAAGIGTGVDVGITCFGNTTAMHDDLAELVVSGPKRATTALARWYGAGGEPFPSAGDHFTVVDGRGRPRCLCRMTRVEVRRFRDVDAAFAWDEGEGDRSLAYWRAAHAKFFRDEAAASNFVFDEDAEVVLQRFEVLYRLPGDPGMLH